MLVFNIFSFSHNVFYPSLKEFPIQIYIYFVVSKCFEFGPVLTLSQTTNFDSSKPKEFADDNFELDENGRKFAKWVENTAGKGEIACYEQFLLFPQSFQKTFTADI